MALVRVSTMSIDFDQSIIAINTAHAGMMGIVLLFRDNTAVVWRVAQLFRGLLFRE